VDQPTPQHPPSAWPEPPLAAPPDASDRAGIPGPRLVLLVLGAAVTLAAAAVWAFGLRSTDEGPYRRLASTEFEVQVDRCSADADGRPLLGGSVRNRSGDRQTLVVEVEVLGPDDLVIDTPRATVVALDDGAQTSWRTGSPYEVGRLTPLTCRVGNVFAAPSG
jgi:hypothetical protein